MRRQLHALMLVPMLATCVIGMLCVSNASAATPAPSAGAAAVVRSTPTDTPVPNSSHYLLLGEGERATYDALVQGIESGLREFDAAIESVDDIEPALHAIVSDHPEYFWLTGACAYQTLFGGGVRIELEYNVDAANIDAIQAVIDEATSSYMASLPEGASDYDKVKAAYEWVIAKTDYGYGSGQHQNVQSVFVDHESVCAGYAKAFQYLLDRAGVPCAYVRGSIEGGAVDHAWNLVWMDGTAAYVDVTWGDPTYTTPGGETSTGNMTYDYLCITSDELARLGHVASPGEPSIECDSNLYDYYRLDGRLFDVYDKAATDAAFTVAFDSGASSASFKFTNDVAFAAAVSALADTSMLDGVFVERASVLQGGTDVVRYHTTDNDALRIVTVFW